MNNTWNNIKNIFSGRNQKQLDLAFDNLDKVIMEIIESEPSVPGIVQHIDDNSSTNNDIDIIKKRIALSNK
jgi:hypothetical protein